MALISITAVAQLKSFPAGGGGGSGNIGDRGGGGGGGETWHPQVLAGNKDQAGPPPQLVPRQTFCGL